MFRKKTVLLFFAVFFFTCSTAVAEETWKITSLNWEPYSGAYLANQGNSIQKLREILKKHNINLLVEFYPWKRAQKLALTKDYVGYFPAWPEEVQEGFVASPPIDWSEIGLLKRSDTVVTFESIDDLFKKYKVGIVKTYVYPKNINSAMLKYPNNTDPAPNEMSLIKKLSKGRNAVSITDPNVMLYLADREGIGSIESLKTIMEKELVMSFRDGQDNWKRINLLKEVLKKKN